MNVAIHISLLNWLAVARNGKARATTRYKGTLFIDFAGLTRLVLN
jgi:hypothetical protein